MNQNKDFIRILMAKKNEKKTWLVLLKLSIKICHLCAIVLERVGCEW